ncbi:MAG: efflux RND transporter periplasmic adaptor subunit, partial [Kangiellaceae bacterium]
MNKSSVKLASKLFNFRVFIALIFAFIVGALLSPLIRITDSEIPSKEENDVAKPLYWVAPMDANYRRDKPGQSPMGMDLVPVYAKSEELSGVIKISPDVVNNLGVRLAKVELKKIKSKIKTVGYVKYDEDHLLHIHPRVEGWIEKLHVKASGNPVNKEQPLYE